MSSTRSASQQAKTPDTPITVVATTIESTDAVPATPTRSLELSSRILKALKDETTANLTCNDIEAPQIKAAVIQLQRAVVKYPSLDREEFTPPTRTQIEAMSDGELPGVLRTLLDRIIVAERKKQAKDAEGVSNYEALYGFGY